MNNGQAFNNLNNICYRISLKVMNVVVQLRLWTTSIEDYINFCHQPQKWTNYIQQILTLALCKATSKQD